MVSVNTSRNALSDVAPLRLQVLLGRICAALSRCDRVDAARCALHDMMSVFPVSCFSGAPTIPSLWYRKPPLHHGPPINTQLLKAAVVHT